MVSNSGKKNQQHSKGWGFNQRVTKSDGIRRDQPTLFSTLEYRINDMHEIRVMECR